MSLIGNVYSFKFFIDSLGCLCSKEEVGRMPRRCAATTAEEFSKRSKFGFFVKKPEIFQNR